MAIGTGNRVNLGRSLDFLFYTLPNQKRNGPVKVDGSMI